MSDHLDELTRGLEAPLHDCDCHLPLWCDLAQCDCVFCWMCGMWFPGPCIEIGGDG